MTPEQHHRISEVFLAAVRLDAEERAAFVQSACGSDLPVRERVEAMLAQHETPGADLDRPALEAEVDFDMVMVAAQDPAAALPKAIGSYRVTDLLGVGGMGVVYRAEQHSPRRTVALKALRPGMVSHASLQRFAHEADILARLTHPGIARIYEAGAAGDDQAAGLQQPYFAMELIDGQPLTTYAQEKQLGLRQRVGLLAEVCDAIHHAHTKGVIHRDLKPGNILVDEAGRPKVLDFGVARIIDAGGPALSGQTRAGQLIGTLAFMSPEQVAGSPRDVDTRCDVYALGVIGYELLAGKPPYDLASSSIPEAARIIQETVPVPLSRIARGVPRDLETIIHKALAKHPDRRYPTAGELGGDLRRFLADEPIVARPPTLGYQLVKFARRHRLTVTAIGLAGLAVVLGVAGIIRGGMVAAEQRNEARRQVKITQAINTFLNEDLLALADPLADPGHDITVKEALDRASASVADRFPEEDEVRAAIELTLGRTYAALGDYESARPHLDTALAIRQRYGASGTAEILPIQALRVELLRRTGQLDGALALARDVVETRRRELGDGHRDTLAAMGDLGQVLIERGESVEAQQILQAAIDRLDSSAADGKEVELAIQLHSNLAHALKWQGHLAEAEPVNEAVVQMAREHWGTNDARTAIALNNLVTLYLRQGRFAEACPLLQEAIDIAEPVLGEDHPELLVFKGNLGTTLMNLQRYEEAAELLEDLYAKTKEVLGDQNTDVIITGLTLATVYRYLDRYENALPIFEEVLEAANASLGEQHPQSLHARSYLGMTLVDLQRYEAAEASLRETLQLYQQALGDGHMNTRHAKNDLARLLVKIGRLDEAEVMYDDILKAPHDKAPHAVIARTIFQTGYGRCLTAQGRFAESQVQLAAADETLAASQWANSQYARDTIKALIELYESWPQPERLAAARDRLRNFE